MNIKGGLFKRARAAVTALTSGSLSMKSVSGLQMITGSASFTDPGAYNLARDGYNSNAIAYYCVNLVASASALVPLRVYKRKMVKGKVVLEHIPDHPLNKFIRKPNNGMSGQRFQHALHAYQLIAGNTYILSRFSNKENMPIGEPIEWDILRPDRTTVTERDGVVGGYLYTGPTGKQFEYPINPATRKTAVLHLKDFSPIDDFYGMPSLQPASKQIDISNQAARFNKAMLDNGARLSVALQVSEDLDDTQVDDIRNQFIESYSGASNAGRPFVLQNIDKVTELGVNPRDMEFTEGQLNAFRLIANAAGVPTYMLGLKDTQSTFNNMQEAKTFFYQTTVAQRITYFYGDTDGDIEGEINIYLQKFYGNDICIKPYWDKVDALAPVREKRHQRAKELTGIATIDEQREIAGFEALNLNGVSDIPWRAVGEAPITFSGTELDPKVNNADSKKPKEDDEDDKAAGGSLEFKLINDTDPVDRRRELAKFDRLLSIFERKFAPKMARIINEQAKLAAAEYQLRGNLAQIEAIFNNSQPKTLDLYVKHYRSVMRFFGNRVMDAFGKNDHIIHERKDADDTFDMAVRRFLEVFAAKAVQLQSETTKGLIRNAIMQGEADGLERRAIAKNIVKAAGGAIARQRSLVIAATETHGAANYAQKYAAIAATGEDRSEWVSAEDSRVRPSHSAVDGQVVEDGEQFNVGGHPADHPGDPSLPADERIRCRCTLAFVTEEE